MTFRFYLIAVAIFFAAYLKTMSDGVIWVSSVIASLGLVFSYVFLRLDLRNKDLIKLSEAVLIIEEEKLETKVNYPEIKILEISNSRECKRTLPPNSYSKAMILLFNLMIFLFFVGALVPHLRGSASFFSEKVLQQKQGASSVSVSQPRDNDEPAAAANKVSQTRKAKKGGN